jgi:hypothetical protein
MKTLLATTAIALLATIGQAHAVNFGDTTNNNLTAKGGNAEATAVSGSVSAASLNAAFKNFLAQQQGQQQAVDTRNNASIKVESQKQPAAVAVSAPSFGAAVSDGVINACSGTEAWSVSLGGAFFTPSGNPVTAGIGGGNQSLTTLNLCEIRAVAWELSGRTEGAKAEAIYHAVMCQHPTYRAAIVATGGSCPTLPQYTMTVSLGSDATVAAASPDKIVAKAQANTGTGSNHPDYAKLQ